MNRKLQHTVQALTTTAAVFGLLLLAGGPAPTGPGSAGLLASDEPAMEAPVAAATPLEASEVPVGQVRRNHRAALAMPYFSFAQGGLRRVAGG